LHDRELLERFRNGDLSAFEAILERYEAPLLRYAGRYNRCAAQDIVQEAFLRLVREFRSSAPSGVPSDEPSGTIEHLSAWLYRVTRNLAVDEARKEKRMERREQLAAVSEVQRPGAADVETREIVDVVEQKLHGLPPKERDVLILKIQEQKSYREISSITGLTPSNVGYLIHKGLKSLASELRTAGVV
jgi:RNA polymerase sigma-70 factor (ECF subfamily)